MPNSIQFEDALVNRIIEVIQDKKGLDITVIDISKLKNAIASYFVICSGNSDRQTQTIAEEIIFQLKKDFKERPIHTEGMKTGEWILVDYGSIIVHVFLPRIREFYALEELWGDGVFYKHENLDLVS